MAGTVFGDTRQTQWEPPLSSTTNRRLSNSRDFADMQTGENRSDHSRRHVRPETREPIRTHSPRWDQRNEMGDADISGQQSTHTSVLNVTKPNIIPNKFDGRVPWRDYARHFEACCLANNWGEEEAKVFLSASLRGPAIKVIGGPNVDVHNLAFKDLIGLLEQRFGPGQLAENYLLELRFRRQGHHETLQELGQAVRDLSVLAYPELPDEAQDRLARTHFIEAIDDQVIREGVFRSRP